MYCVAERAIGPQLSADVLQDLCPGKLAGNEHSRIARHDPRDEEGHGDYPKEDREHEEQPT